MRVAFLFRVLFLALGLSVTLSRPFSQEENITGRFLRNIACDPDHHASNGICCLNCPTGTYVKSYCKEENSTGTCFRCADGIGYTEHPNGMDMCLTCSVCNPDQDVISRCTSYKNTVCQCKPGTFCQPDQACEVCRRCKTSCSEGEVMVKECQPTSDIECQPASGTLSPGEIAAVVICILVLLIVVAIIWRCCSKKHKRNQSSDDGDSAKLSKTQQLKMCFKNSYLKNLKTTFTEDKKQSEPLVRNTQPTELQNSDNTTYNGTPPMKMQKYEPGKSCTDHHRQRHVLVAAESDPREALRQSFDVFVELVPAISWKPFMRCLKLTDNEIFTAEKNNDGNRQEQCFNMLSCWMQKTGREATINGLLEMLTTMELRGVEEQIRDEVTRKGYYKYTIE
ncbi:tumor necrosis factor receptor superfamily member 10B-like [Protopterus annectens]|uniref:tumor necrosis factor receptor superfamily member 10B-like n=1 Tax=Protopterus annectens TaxID=7888 RepID=UPI001CFADAE4|nr:tumor necrosis factor receptor superfamily member 10B-like [Protopterus annectens]